MAASAMASGACNLSNLSNKALYKVEAEIVAMDAALDNSIDVLEAQASLVGKDIDCALSKKQVDDDANDDHCHLCGEIPRVICCEHDGCRHSCCLECAGLKFASIPVGQRFCCVCRGDGVVIYGVNAIVEARWKINWLRVIFNMHSIR